MRYDSGDTDKLPKMTKAEYEEFLDDMEDTLLREIEINEGPERLMSGGAAAAGEEEILPEEDEVAATAGDQNKEDSEAYNEFIRDIKTDLFRTTIGKDGEKSVFQFDRVTDDLYGFKNRIAVENDERAKALGKIYDEDDSDLYTE